jgi:hypothetical protein
MPLPMRPPPSTAAVRMGRGLRPASVTPRTWGGWGGVACLNDEARCVRDGERRGVCVRVCVCERVEKGERGGRARSREMQMCAYVRARVLVCVLMCARVRACRCKSAHAQGRGIAPGVGRGAGAGAGRQRSTPRDPAPRMAHTAPASLRVRGYPGREKVETPPESGKTVDRNAEHGARVISQN